MDSARHRRRAAATEALTAFLGGGVGTALPTDRLPIRAAFCSSRDTNDRVIFDPEYFPYLWWRWKAFGEIKARDDFYRELQRKRDNGITHVVIDPPDGTAALYRADGLNWITDSPAWMQDGGQIGALDPTFVEMVHEIVGTLGFFAVWYCFGGGQADAPRIYDGSLRRMCEAIVREGWVSRGVFGWAWESYGLSRECSERQNNDAWGLMREVLGPDAMLFGHLDGQSQRISWASAPREEGFIIPDTPTFEIEAWHETTGVGGGALHGQEIALHFHQLRAATYGPEHGYMARLIECLDRVLPRGTAMPGVGTEDMLRDDPRDTRPVPSGPDWNGRARRAGPLTLVDWEPGIPYPYIRRWIGDDTVREVYRKHVSLGIAHFGCMPVE